MRTMLSPRRLGGLLAALAVLITPLAATTVMTAAPASASSPYDNTDPRTTHCWDSHAFVVKQADTVYGGPLQLWWSPTCQTNWAQVDSETTDTTWLWTETQDGRQTTHFQFSYNGWAWSNQLYARTTNARACEQVFFRATKEWGPVVCVGQY